MVNYPWGKYLGKGNVMTALTLAFLVSRIAPITMPAMAKAGAKYMNSQLIKMESIVNGYVEGIALDVNGLRQ